jgi:hypothetical protein
VSLIQLSIIQLSIIGTRLANRSEHSSWLSLVGLDPAAIPADWLPDAFYAKTIPSSIIFEDFSN